MAQPCYTIRKFLHLICLVVRETLHKLYSQIFGKSKSLFLTFTDLNHFHFQTEWMTSHTQHGDMQEFFVHNRGVARCWEMTNKHDLNKIVEDVAIGGVKPLKSQACAGGQPISAGWIQSASPGVYIAKLKTWLWTINRSPAWHLTCFTNEPWDHMAGISFLYLFLWSLSLLAWICFIFIGQRSELDSANSF